MRKTLALFLFLFGTFPLWMQAQQDSCAITSLPYTEDFSSFQQYLLIQDSCWTSLYYTSYNMPTIVMQGDGNGNCLQLSGEYDFEYNIAVMPLLDYSYDIHTVMVSLYLKKSALSGCFEVGVMTDPTDESTFFPIDTLQNPTTIAFYPHHVYLNNYSGTGRYIAFRWRTYTAIFDPHYAWVDDITLQESTGCPEVEELRASNVTGTSAVLRWNDGPIGTVTGHTIEYIDSDSTITTITDVVGNEFALSWLTPNTTYNVNVSANCDNDSTSLPASISFTTACASGGDLLFGEENHITSRNFPIHKYALTEEIYTASEIGAARNLQSVSFHCTTAGSDRNIALYLMPVEQSMLTGFIPINSTAVKVFDGIVNMSAGWVTLYFDDNYYYDGSSNLLVVIDDNTNAYGSYTPNSFFFVDEPVGNMVRIANTWNTNYNPSSVSSYNGTIYHYRHRIKFGDVCDNQASCVAPYTYLSDISETFAQLNIVPGNGESSWTVEYRGEQDTLWTTDSSVTYSPYYLGSLAANTNYWVRVKPNCGNGISDHWATRSFRTTCGELPLPYSEDFETSLISEADGYFLSCWQRYSTADNPTATVATSLSEAHSGEHYLNLSAAPNDTTIVVLPGIYNILLSSLEIEFYLSDPGNDTLEIGVMYDPSDPDSFLPLDIIHPYSTNSYEKIVYPFLHYTDFTTHIAFRRTGGTAGNLKIDDLTVREATGCYVPLDVQVSDILAFSAEIDWTEPGNATQWSIEYGVSGFTQGTGTVVTVDALPFTLSGLLADHTYDFYVRCDCDTDHHSDWSNVYTFSTPCYEIDHFPFSENFNAAGTGNGIHSLPECWGRLNTQYVEIQFSSPSSGYLCFIYDPGIAVMPRLADYDSNGNPIDIRHLKLDLDARYYDNADHITVGVMTDPNDASTFQAVKDIDVGYDYSSNFRHDEVFFYGYTGNGRYIAVKNRNASYAVADNFVISQLDYTCSAPEGLTCGNIGSSSAIVTWQSGAVGDAQEYTLQYKPQGDSVWTTAASNISESQYFLTGLTPNTWYDVRVRTLCTDSTYGEWATTTFQTECLSGGYAYIGNGTSTSSYQPVSNWHTSISRQLYYQSEVGGPGYIYSVSFQTNNPLTNQRNWKIYLQHTSLSEFSYTAVLDNLPPVKVFEGTVNIHDGWFTIYFDTPFYYNGTSNLVLTTQDYTGSQASYTNSYYVHSCPVSMAANSTTLPPDHPFDYQWSFSSNRNNVIFRKDCDSNATCGIPNLMVDSVIGNEAYLTWAAGYQETQWELEYKMAESTVWNSYSNPTGFHVTLSGLQMNSLYEARMRAVCGTNDYGSWTYVSFTTGCGAIVTIPYSEDFEDNITNDFVNCWSRLEETATVIDNQGTTPSVTTNHCLFLTRYQSSSPFALAVLPELGSGINPANLVVSLTMKSLSSNNLLEIGVMTDPDVTASFVPLDTLFPTNLWTEASVPLNNYNGNGKFIAIRMSTASPVASVMVDDILVEVISSCAKPTNLTVTNITESMASLDWNTLSTPVAGWEVEYGPYGFTHGNGTTLTLSDSTATLTGLDANATYTAYVRSDCGGGEFSNWISVTFTTACGSITPPYFQDFEDSDVFPDCWEQEFLTNTLEWSLATPSDHPTSAHSGSQAIHLKNTKTASDITMLISPTFRLQGFGNPVLHFWHTQAKWVNDQDTLAVLYRTAPDAEWTLLASYNQDIPNWTLDSLSLPNGTDTYQIAFQGTVKYGYGIFIDDISITAVPLDTCQPVTGLTATDTGNHHITLSWTPEETDYWVVYFRISGTSVWDSLQTTTPSVTLDALQVNTPYDIYVVSYCEGGLPAASDTISVSTTNVGILTLELARDIQLFPNPTSGTLTVTSVQSPIIRIEVCDLAGRTMTFTDTDSNTVRMDLSELAAGIYFVRVQTEAGTVTKRVVKR